MATVSLDEVQEFLVAIPRSVLANDLALVDHYGGIQGGDTFPLVFKGSSLHLVGPSGGRVGFVRSRARTAVFPSTLRTRAFSGGSRHNPRIARTLVSNSGPVLVGQVLSW